LEVVDEKSSHRLLLLQGKQLAMKECKTAGTLALLLRNSVGPEGGGGGELYLPLSPRGEAAADDDSLIRGDC
jgi:hypothetical protein